MFSNPCASAWPVGPQKFYAAALASTADAHPMACTCTSQLLPVSKLVSLAAAH